jgi:hypothetical protein
MTLLRESDVATSELTVSEAVEQFDLVSRVQASVQHYLSDDFSDSVRVHYSYLNDFVEPYEPIRDALGRPIEGFDRLPEQSIAFLVDPYPNANWSHPCLIVTFDARDDIIFIAQHDWPPMQTHQRHLILVDFHKN